MGVLGVFERVLGLHGLGGWLIGLKSGWEWAIVEVCGGGMNGWRGMDSPSRKILDG